MYNVIYLVVYTQAKELLQLEFEAALRGQRAHPSGSDRV